MGWVVPIVVVITLIIYTAVAVVQADSEQVRNLPKFVWLLVVLLLPIIGAACWWLFGRPLAVSHHQPVAPDDDPDFLRTL